MIVINIFFSFPRFQKGSLNLRSKSVKCPSIDQYYAEQIVAFLIIENYLKEDFHLTAYSTISYIRRGTRDAKKESTIMFYGARILALPNIGNSIIVNTEILSTSTKTLLPQQTNNEVAIVSATKSNKSNKKRKSSEHTNDDSSCKGTPKSRRSRSSHREKSSNRGRSNKKGQSKSDKSNGTQRSARSRNNERQRHSPSTQESSTDDSDSSTITIKKSRFSQIVAEVVTNETNRRKRFSKSSTRQHNDDLILLPLNGEIIEID